MDILSGCVHHVSNPTGPPRLFRPGSVQTLVQCCLRFNPDRAAQAVSPITLLDSMNYQLLFQSRPGRPGCFATNGCGTTSNVYQVSIPTGPPRLFRRLVA